MITQIQDINLLLLQEFSFQTNSTYHRAIKITPYQVAFNRVPNYQRLPIPLRNISENGMMNQRKPRLILQ